MIRIISISILAAMAALALAAQSPGLPPDEAGAPGRLAASPRHGEWVSYEAAGGDRVEAYLAYPERKDKAPVVVVIHEIFGLSDWVRSVADQLAAEGFIAIAPDFLSGKGPEQKGSRGLGVEAARALMGGLSMDEVMRRVEGAARYATALPAATGAYAALGYCWGGGVSFGYATRDPRLGAAVVYYGGSPPTASLGAIRAPVLGLYGGNDARVNATIPPAAEELKRLGKSFEYHLFDGAGHGFLRQQGGQSGANLRATEAAWPLTLRFLRERLGDTAGVDATSGATGLAPRPGPHPVLATFGAEGHALGGHGGEGCDEGCYLPFVAMAP